MLRNLGRIRNLLRKKVDELMLIIRVFFRFSQKDRLAWLAYVLEHRLLYNIDALYAGVQMNRNGRANLYNFRRNIHMLEKGLSHKQLKDSFAEAYILETVNYLAQLKSLGASEESTIAWGEAVLDLYFKTVTHTRKNVEAYELFQRLEPKNSQPTLHLYYEKYRPDVAVEYETLYQLSCRRRSVRHYLDKTVEFGLVEKAMKVAALSPSACNRQPFKFLFYNDETIVRRITETPGGISGYELPSVVVVIGSYRAYFDERDINAPIIDASLATMAFLFALETLGLSSVCIGWPNLPDRDKKIRQLIHLDEDEIIVMLIGIGYPDSEGTIPYSAKKDINELLLCNERLKDKWSRIIRKG